jgi:predicted amidophosphoribosyltransferase
VAAYDGAVRQCLLAYKERGWAALRRPLAEALAAAISAALAETISAGPAAEVVVVAMPSRRQAIRDRGDDVVADLARTACARLRRLGYRSRPAPALRLNRQVRDSAGLGAQARLHNLSGAMAVRSRWVRALDGAQLVLVDDVVTTGATLAAAAAVLRAVGAMPLASATVAATQRRLATSDAGSAFRPDRAAATVPGQGAPLRAISRSRDADRRDGPAHHGRGLAANPHR